MTYAQQLREHYKAVKERLRANAIKPAKALPPPTPDLLVESAARCAPEEAGLFPKSAERSLVSDALREVNTSWIGGNYAQAIKIAEEMADAPKLPPLPGLNLSEPGGVRWLRILHAVAAHHEVNVKDILSGSRKKHVINARFEVFYRLRVDLNFSYMKIGTLMKRDHSSVMHGVYKVKESLLDAQNKKTDDERPFAVNHPTVSGSHTNSQSAVNPIP